MGDLLEAAARLEKETSSPAEVRRLFQQFVVLTQKLTSAMRKDFTRIAGRHFQASTFTGWTAVTEFFKLLRNTDLHDLPITIEMQHEKYIPLPHNLPGIPPLRLVLGYNQELPTQLTTNVPQTASIEREEPNGSRINVPFSDSHHVFIIQSRTPQVAKKLAALPTANVHMLTAECVKTLENLYHFFEIEVCRHSSGSA